jgi:hypothetical protein
MSLSIRKFVFGVWFLLFVAFVAWAQEDHASLNSTFNRHHVHKTSTHKTLKAIYKRNNKNKMLSNECVREYTSSKLGYEYVMLTGDCEKSLGHLSGSEIELHNFLVNLGITLRRGPFWKLGVKKRYKFCRERMGEYVE